MLKRFNKWLNKDTEKHIMIGINKKYKTIRVFILFVILIIMSCVLFLYSVNK